jgi:hemoglobin
MIRTLVRLATALAAVASIVACSSMETMKPMQDQSLYARLGGKPAITAVVDDFIGNVAADSRINGRFANANIPHLKMELVDQICAASGGPCTYTGKDMVSAHKGMNIRGPEFDALVEDLVKSLDKFNVPAKEKGELLGALGPLKPAIVGQ